MKIRDRIFLIFEPKTIHKIVKGVFVMPKNTQRGYQRSFSINICLKWLILDKKPPKWSILTSKLKYAYQSSHATKSKNLFEKAFFPNLGPRMVDLSYFD